MTEQETIVDALARFVDSDNCPAIRIPIPINSSFNFGFHADGGLCVLRAGTRESWELHIMAGLAHGVTEVGRAVMWANSKNHETLIGRYFCSILGDGSACAAVYGETLSHRLVDFDSDRFCNWIFNLINFMARTAADESREFLMTCGGRPFEPADLLTLVQISL